MCDWCGDGVEVGQPYFAYRWSDGVDSGSVAMHPECYQAMQDDVCLDYGDGFTPFSHCRGCSCERPRCECGKEQQMEKKTEDNAVAEAQAYFRQFKRPGVSVVDELIEERREEAEREQETNGRKRDGD